MDGVRHSRKISATTYSEQAAQERAEYRAASPSSAVRVQSSLSPANSGPIRSPSDAHHFHFHDLSRQASGTGLKRSLNWIHLTAIGVGCTIGAGIFVVTGIVANQRTGPALFLSYIIAGLVSFFAALSYAEFAGMVPRAGSAYTYAYVTLGERIGWIIGWDLILEYGVAAATVAQGWSHYFRELMRLMNIPFPAIISGAPWDFDGDSGAVKGTGAVFDLPAVVIVIIITAILYKGISESASFNAVMVFLKVFVVLFVVFAGLAYVHSSNFTPFMPYGFSGFSVFGYTVWGQVGPDGKPAGVLAGAALVFFAYAGFDAVTCQSEEACNPQQDVPKAVIASLGITTVLYVAVSLVLVGMVPYTEINQSAPLSAAFGQVGLFWAEYIIGIGALAGVTSVLMVTMMGQPRILMAMARDGLLPPSVFAYVHPVYKTPSRGTVVTGVFCAFFSSLLPMGVLVELVSIGTLLAFLLVSIGIIVLRRTRPDIPRPFRTPFVPYFPACGALLCLMLMLSLPAQNWLRLIIWLVIGLTVYYFYGRFAHTRRMTGPSFDNNRMDDDELELELTGSGVAVHGRRDSGDLGHISLSTADENMVAEDSVSRTFRSHQQQPAHDSDEDENDQNSFGQPEDRDNGLHLRAISAAAQLAPATHTGSSQSIRHVAVSNVNPPAADGARVGAVSPRLNVPPWLDQPALTDDSAQSLTSETPLNSDLR